MGTWGYDLQSLRACGHLWIPRPQTPFPGRADSPSNYLCQKCGHYPGPDSDPEQSSEIPPMSLRRMVERTVLKSSVALFWLAVMAVMGAMAFLAVQ